MKIDASNRLIEASVKVEATTLIKITKALWEESKSGGTDEEWKQDQKEIASRLLKSFSRQRIKQVQQELQRISDSKIGSIASYLVDYNALPSSEIFKIAIKYKLSVATLDVLDTICDAIIETNIK